jgi:hypothetical protein
MKYSKRCWDMRIVAESRDLLEGNRKEKGKKNELSGWYELTNMSIIYAIHRKSTLNISYYKHLS